MWTKYWRRPRLFDALGALTAIACACLALPAMAQQRDVPVDLELVVAVDVSGSIDADEARLQRDGYVGAFSDAEVIGAIKGGMLGRIAVTYIEWAGIHHATTIVGWTLIDSEERARAFAKAPIGCESRKK